MAKRQAKTKPGKPRSKMIYMLLVTAFIATGLLFTVRMNHVANITSNITAKPGSNLGISNVSWFDQSNNKAIVQPSEGQKYITVSLGVTNISQIEQWATPVTQAYVMDSQNQNHGLELVASNDPFQAGPLKPGASIAGELSFMVPGGDNGLKLCYLLDGADLPASCVALNEYNKTK